MKNDEYTIVWSYDIKPKEIFYWTVNYKFDEIFKIRDNLRRANPGLAFHVVNSKHELVEN